MAVGSERGTTNLDVLAVDQLFVAGTTTGSVGNFGTSTTTQENFTNLGVTGTATGTAGYFTQLHVKGSITGSKMTVGTLSYTVEGDVDATGSVTGTYLVGSYIHGASIIGSIADVKGTITGSVANLTTVGLKGTLSGGVVNGTYVNAAEVVGSNVSAANTVAGSTINGSNINAKGTITGSFIKGTLAPTDVVGSSIKRAHMLASSGTIQVTAAAPGTFVHGLGAAPTFVSVVPIANFAGAAGTEGMPLYYNSAPDATAVYVAGGTTGTAWVYALA